MFRGARDLWSPSLWYRLGFEPRGVPRIAVNLGEWIMPG
jgi:hypothetical protein